MITDAINWLFEGPNFWITNGTGVGMIVGAILFPPAVLFLTMELSFLRNGYLPSPFNGERGSFGLSIMIWLFCSLMMSTVLNLIAWPLVLVTGLVAIPVGILSGPIFLIARHLDNRVEVQA